LDLRSCPDLLSCSVHIKKNDNERNQKSRKEIKWLKLCHISRIKRKRSQNVRVKLDFVRKSTILSRIILPHFFFVNVNVNVNIVE
jgi:hypothetical protein